MAVALPAILWRIAMHTAQYPATDIQVLRDHLHLSQAVLAALLNTSLSTVLKWEAGDKHPSGPSLKLLILLDCKGLEAVL